MEISGTFVCAYCLQLNEIQVDGTAGSHQEYIEDCQVCCRSNALEVTVTPSLRSASIEARMAD